MELQLIANSLKQEIPTISVRAHSFRYIFNMQENYFRFSKRFNQHSSAGMAIFATNYKSETMGALVPLVLQLHLKRQAYNTRFYLNSKSYQYACYAKRFLGLRMLHCSLYDLQNRKAMLGVRNQQQIELLLGKDKKKLIKGEFTNEELVKTLVNPANAGQYISNQNGDIVYNDNRIQIRPFKIGKQSQQYFNYICIPNKTNHNLNMEKLSKISKLNKVSIEQIREQMIKNGSYESKQGKIDISEMSDQKSIPAFVILHYKTLQNLEQITQHSQLKKYLKLVDECSQITTMSVVHIVQGDGSVLLSEQFTQLQNKFHKKTKHILYNQFYRFYQTAEELRIEVTSIYPHFLLNYHISPYSKGISANLVSKLMESYQKGYFSKRFQQSNNSNGEVVLFKPKHQLVLFPFQKQGYFRVLDSSPQVIVRQIPQITKIMNEAKLNVISEKQKQMKLTLQKILNNFDPTVIFLGTSSKMPNYFRNVSGILIKIPDKQKSNAKGMSIIMDCGEGTLFQMMNHFGPTECQEQILKVKVLFITHLHSDHSCGIFNFIKKRNEIILRKIEQNQISKQEIQDNKLWLIIPEIMTVWFATFSKTVQKIDQFCNLIFTQSLCQKQFLIHSNKYFPKKKTALFSHSNQSSNEFQLDQQEIYNLLHPNSSQCDTAFEIDQIANEVKTKEQNQMVRKYTDIQKKLISKFQSFLKYYGLSDFQPIPVVHCQQSFGLVIQHESSVKISYSGDCRPSEMFGKLAMNSTLLIHEATFNDYQQLNAIRSKHSTFQQAVTMGFNSFSLMTALTHLSGKIQFDKKSNNTDNKLNTQIERIKPRPLTKNSKFECFERVSIEQYKQSHTFKCFDHMEFKLSQAYRLPQFCEVHPRLFN